MGLMKLIQGRKPTKAESENCMVDAPWVIRPPGPVHTDLAPVTPARASLCGLDAIRRQSVPVWVAVNTYHKGYNTPTFARWYNRRGAIFLHRRMYSREAQLRALAEDGWFDNDPLSIPEYVPVLERNADGQMLVAPADAPRVAPLDNAGRLTKKGFDGLEDAEFVWPWLDVAAPIHRLPREAHGLSELHLGMLFERAWPDHWYGQDRAGREPREDEPGTFALAYAGLLKECGRAGSGTRLGKWLDVWLERAEKEWGRLHA